MENKTYESSVPSYSPPSTTPGNPSFHIPMNPYSSPPPSYPYHPEQLQPPPTITYTTPNPLPARYQPTSSVQPLAIFLNFLWFLIGGGIPALIIYVSFALLMAITIIGWPLAVDLLRAGVYVSLPFGYEGAVANKYNCKRFWLQVLWIPFGLCLYFYHLGFAMFWFLTIVGIPFGLQHFALAKVAFYPFGLQVNRKKFGCSELLDVEYYLKTSPPVEFSRATNV